MSNWNSNVPLFQDGVSTLDAADTNAVVTALANRDQYLFERISSYADKTILLSYNQPILESITPGTPVYFDTTSDHPVLKPAMGGFLSTASVGHLEPAQSSYVFGLIKQIYSGPSNPIVYGDVYVRGLIDANDPELSGTVNFYNNLDTSSQNEIAALVPGPLYLSSEESGKLTIFPSGAAVFVGYYIGDNKLVLAPNIDSLDQLYFNYHLYLMAQPCGTQNEYTSGHWNVTHAGNNISADANYKVGWINATDAVVQYGLVAPAGAKFFYNVPISANIVNSVDLTQEEINDALLFKKALPAYPGAYTMLFANGVLQTQYDIDHTDGAYIIDENGIWWMSDATNYTPWSTGISSLCLQLFITKLNPNFGDSLVTSLVSASPAIKVLGSSGQTASTGDLQVKLILPITNINGTGNGTTIQSVSFNPDLGQTNLVTASVINGITAGPGLAVNTTNGQATIGLAGYSLSGEVTDIEPEEADYVFKGLHSYMRIKPPVANQRIGFVGKLKLPDTIPASLNLYIKLAAFADATTSISDNIPFAFEYSTSNETTSISNAITSSTVNIAGNLFQPLVQNTLYENSSNVAYFMIPYSIFSGGSYINFRIARTYGTNTNMIGILGVLWVIE